MLYLSPSMLEHCADLYFSDHIQVLLILGKRGPGASKSNQIVFTLVSESLLLDKSAPQIHMLDDLKFTPDTRSNFVYGARKESNDPHAGEIRDVM